MKNIYKYISMLLMFSYLGGYAQTEPEVILLENDMVIVNYYDANGNLSISQIVENYSNSEQLDMSDGNSPVDDFGDEELIDLISFPEQEKGAQPSDYCYNPQNHKYYIYGGTKVLIYNSFTDELITSLEISESQDWFFFLYPNIKFMEYSEFSNKVYCVTPDNTVVIIDGETNQFSTYDLGSSNNIIIRSVYIDNVNGNFYVTMNFLSGNNANKTKLFKFSEAGNIIQDQIFNYLIRDIECISTNYLYISTNAGIYKIDKSNLANETQIVTGVFSDMGLAINESKIFVSEENSNSIYIIDLTDEQNITIINNSFSVGFDAAYNPIDSRMYFIGFNTDGHLSKLIIDINSETVLDESETWYPVGIEWVGFNATQSRLYVRTINHPYFPFGAIYSQYGNSTNQIASYLSQNYGQGKVMSYNPDQEKLISLNTTSGFFHIQDKLLTSINKTEQTGGWSSETAYNFIDNKIYVIDNKLNDELTTLSIYDGTNFNLIDNLDVGNYSKKVMYSDVTGKAYILNDDGQIHVIDGVSNNIEQTLSIGSINPASFLTSKNQYMVCGSIFPDKLCTFSLQSYNRTDININTGNPYKVEWGTSGYLYLNSGSISTQNYLTKINLPGTIEWTTEIDYNKLLVFSPADTTIFSQIDNNIVKISNENGEELASYPLGGHIVKDAIYSPKNDELIVLVEKQGAGYSVWKLDCSSLSLFQNSEILPSGKYISLFLNEKNDKLYAYEFFDNSDKKAKLLSFDPESLELLSSTSLGPKHSTTDVNITFPYPAKMNISLNTNTNQLIIPNWNYSNFSVVQCPEEERTLKNGWNWVSFPKLERTDDDPVDLAPLLNTLEPMPSQMLVQHRLNTEGNPMTDALYDEDIGQWTFNNLNDLQSTKGYKIEITDGDDEFQLTTPGNRLDPAHPIMLAGDMVENWIGYYEYQSASDPFEALAFCLDNLRVIKMQNWSAFYEVIGIDKGIPIYGWISVKPRPVKYGDMMIVQGINDCELIWNQIPKPGGKDLAEASYFDYEEQADYSSVFIVLDENTNATEIGAYIGGTCVGATVVEEGDEMVEIQAYLQGVEGDEMYFETHSTNKSAPTRPSEYFVKDFNTLQYVNRKIRPYDQKPFHMVSFKNEIIENLNDLIVYHYPNPAQDEVNIHFNLPEDGQVSLELMNVNGKLIEKIDLGSYPMGTNEFSYKIPASLSKGVYLYKFITDNTTVVNQLVVQ